MKSIFNFFKNSEEIKPSADLIDGRISYKFRNGLEAYQEEFDTDQNEKLVQVLMQLNTESLSKELSVVQVSDIINLLIKENLITKILDIVLLRKKFGTEEDNKLLRSLKNSELLNVVNDFFSLNPTVITLFKTFGKDLISLPTTRSI